MLGATAQGMSQLEKNSKISSCPCDREESTLCDCLQTALLALTSRTCQRRRCR
jgi:hypothetical protein